MTSQEKHIVDVLFEERAEHLMRSPLLWSIVKQFFYPIVRYHAAKELVDRVQKLSGQQSFDLVMDRLQMDVQSRWIDRVPTKGPLIVVPNHPTGITDGIVVWQALRQVRPDMTFFANRDAVRASHNLSDVIIPVEWVEEKRTPARNRETLAAAVQALKDERAVVLFPSGRLSQNVGGRLVEWPWMTTPLSLARKFDCPLLPLAIEGRNSRLYYFLAKIHEELKNMTLFSEMLNKKGHRYDLTFGQPVTLSDLPADLDAAVEILKDYVENDLPSDRPWRGAIGTEAKSSPAPAIP